MTPPENTKEPILPDREGILEVMREANEEQRKMVNTKDSETPKSEWEKEWEKLKCSATQVGGMIGFEASKDIIFIKNLLQQQTERHAREINRILNLYSKPIAEGGLDYIKAFEEMERYEHRLFDLITYKKSQLK